MVRWALNYLRFQYSRYKQTKAKMIALNANYKNQQSHVKLCGFQRGMKTKSPKLELTNE